jgi:2'-hydroxyisoflavone reductase
VLAPGRPDRYLQFIDARDLADWTVSMTERKATGVYNATGLPNKLTMGELLQECKTVSNSNASLIWVDEEFLLRENLKAWGEMPLWLPEDAAPDLTGFMFIRIARALAAGLSFRPLRDTVSDTLSWFEAEQLNGKLKAGIDPHKEESLLEKWRTRGETF